MTSIREAKKKLAHRFFDSEGFVGVGLTEQDGRPALRVYVADADSPAAVQIKALEKGLFEGFPVVLVIEGEIEAL